MIANPYAMLVRARHSFKGCFFFFQRVSLMALLVKNPPAMQETSVQFLGWKIPWRRDRLPTPVFLDFP